jgi:hypothetical protein
LHFYAKLFSHRATGKFGIFDSYSSVYWIGSVFFCTKSGLRGLDVFLRHIPGVPLTLHPRLYSDARVRGLKYNIRALCKNLGKD